MQIGLRALGWLMMIAGALLAAFGLAVFVVDTAAVILLFFVGAGSMPDPSSLVLVVGGACLLAPGYGLVRQAG
jgi:hypothetical protein